MQVPFDPNPTVAPAPATGAFLNVPERPNAFGVGVAQAGQRMGATLADASNETAQTAQMFQREYNETAVDSANTSYEASKRAVLFGPDGFYSKRGRDAMDAMQPTEQQLEGLRVDTRATLANPEQQRMFDYISRNASRRELYQMQGHATTEFKVWQGETAKGAIDNEVNNSATYWNDDQRFAQSVANIKMQAQNLLKLKGIDPNSDVGRAEITHYTSEAWSARVRSVMQTDPDMARALFDANADYFDAAHRATLDAQITQHQWTSMMRDDAQSRRDEALADKQLRQTQTTNEANILADEYSGKPHSMTQLADLVRTQQISPAMLGAIRAARNAAADAPSDPRLLASFYSRVGDPNNPLTKEEVLNAAGRGIHGSAAAGLMQALNAQGRREDNPVAQGYYASLKTALAGHNVEQGTVDLTHQAGREQAQLWAQAQAEWTRRVKVGNEDPQQVFADMMPRYQRDVVVPASWPAPRFGSVTSLQDVATVAQRTQGALKDGQISQQQADDQTRLLSLYESFYKDQQARQQAAVAAARAATTKKPDDKNKAKIRGVMPAAEQ